MTLTKVLKVAGLHDRATVHGMRTSFKTWTMEQTDTPWAVGEAALAHQLGGAVAQAYARSDLFDRRRVLMQQWADYLSSQPILSLLGHSGVFETGVGPLPVPHYGSASRKRCNRPVTMIATKCPNCAPS